MSSLGARDAAFALYCATCLGALTWPGYDWLGNRIAGLAAGSVVTTLFVAWPELRPFAVHAGLYGLVANVFVMALVSRFTSAPEDAAGFLRDTV